MNGFEMRKYWLLDVLVKYRETPPDTFQRKFIDRLIDISRRAAGENQTAKQYHNLIVLRYITETRPPVQRICKALHLSREKKYYDTVTEHAIDRLLVLAFGVDGINWEAPGVEP